MKRVLAYSLRKGQLWESVARQVVQSWTPGI